MTGDFDDDVGMCLEKNHQIVEFALALIGDDVFIEFVINISDLRFFGGQGITHFSLSGR